MNKIIISDATLRDGNHAVKHQLSLDNITKYASAAEAAGVGFLEIGHGNGLGASSIQIGLSKETDMTMLMTARKQLEKTLLSVHVIPGFATIKKDIEPAIDIGVDVFRVASHCTEADTTERHISYVREHGKAAYGVLMMSHMAAIDKLVEEAIKMEYYGAQGIIIMDSSGTYTPIDVQKRIQALRKALNCEVGFHGHNNLGLAVANSLIAIESGATIIDACARGFGAGAGNTQIEALIAACKKLNINTGVDLYKILDAADLADSFIENPPVTSSISIVSGLAGVFSGFLKPVAKAAVEYNIDPRDIFFKLGEKKIIAGQEDMIIDVAIELANNNKLTKQPIYE